MSIRTDCPECGTTHRFKDDADGKRIGCKECGKPFRVHGPEEREASPAPARAPTPPPVPAASPSPEPWFYSYIRTCGGVVLGGGILTFVAGFRRFALLMSSDAPAVTPPIALAILGQSLAALLASMFLSSILMLGVDIGQRLRDIQENTRKPGR